MSLDFCLFIHHCEISLHYLKFWICLYCNIIRKMPDGINIFTLIGIFSKFFSILRLFPGWNTLKKWRRPPYPGCHRFVVSIGLGRLLDRARACNVGLVYSGWTWKTCLYPTKWRHGWLKKFPLYWDWTESFWWSNQLLYFCHQPSIWP